MLTTKEAAEKLNVSYPTVMSWIRRGRLKAKEEETYRGKVWLIDPDVLDKFEPPQSGRPQTPESQLKYPRRKSRRKVE